MANLDGKKQRILLVEDHEDEWELAALTLPEYTLICARDFDGGLRLAKHGYFDLYILDNWLTDKSGVELCLAVREFDPHTPILFYSAAAYAKDIQEGIRAGAQAYLVKPTNPAKLRQVVARLISVSPETAFEARRAEIAAIREELDIRRMEDATRLESAKRECLRAGEKALRLKGLIAFLAAGGTRGDFAREWPSVFTEEARGRHTSDAVSGR
jgi:DNA-binding response OmpR family regulator